MTAAAPVPELFAGPLGEQLMRRLERAIGDAREVLGRPATHTRAPDLELVRDLIDALRSLPGVESGHAVRDHEAALGRLHQRFTSRFEALARVQAAISDLREITSPTELLARAPAALCDGSRLERVILSIVRDGLMAPEAIHFDGDPRGARVVSEQLRAEPIRLEHPLIETELMRRRRATIVLDASVHPRVERRFVELMGCRSYAAAPLVIGTRVIGLIHADRGREQQVDALDRDILWEFASGLAHAYETATLRRALRGERDQMRQFVEWLGALSGALSDAPLTLAPSNAVMLVPPEPLDPSAPAEGRDDRLVFEGLLTKRELEVLRLLAEGSTNKAIADGLVISSGTVKFHVNSILRKLHAANRAEAVSRYLRLLGMRTP